MDTALLTVLTAFEAFVASVPSQGISVLISLIVLSVIVYVNFVRPFIRRRKLKFPVEAWFVIPSKKHHGCDFAVQDKQEHLTKVAVVPRDSEVILDFRFKPRVFFSSSEITIGCEDEHDSAPVATEYFNRFVEKGDGKIVVPGPGNRHYIDKHGFYHYRETPRNWSSKTIGAMAFKFRTRRPGRYAIDIYFLGDEVEGKNSELIVQVEDSPQTVMRCTEPKHRRLLCTKVGIRPLSQASGDAS
jgi:hypothetical protein